MALNYGFFKKLINCIGPSGYETDATAIWKREISKATGSVSIDNCGSGIARVGPKKGPKVMIATHIDEIGYMVQYIDKQGYIYFSPLGGVDRHVMPGSRIRIKAGKGEVFGVIGRKPIHLLEPKEREAVSKLENMWIDIGVSSDKEALKKVSIGDCAVPDVGYEELGKDKIIGKGFDDRAGVFVMTEVMKAISKDKGLKAQVYGVATVQEELGLRGAKTAAYGIAPDIGLAMDVTFASDCPGIDKRKCGDIKIGKGPVIARGPNIHPEIFKRLVDVAKKTRTPYQIEGVSRPTGTDANAIQMTKAGVKTGLVSIPNRYMHTPVELVSKKDLENTVKLVKAFVRSIK